MTIGEEGDVTKQFEQRLKYKRRQDLFWGMICLANV